MTDGKPVLLSSGNPQIAKAEGDAPVQAYIAAMPLWKSAMGQRIDGLVVATVPDVRKAVKWNTPLYGRPGDGWFLGMYCYRHYIQVTFFRGTSLQPMPPKPSKTEAVRYLEIREGAELDEVQFIDWLRQASQLPGQKL
jgi:hypothetical protein